MTTPIVSPHNNNTHTRTRAEAAAERYRAAVARPGRNAWAMLRPWLLAGLAGLVLGAALTLAVVSQAAPLAGAQQARNAEIVIQNDGTRAFLVSGWIVPLPKAEASPAAGQP